IVPMVVPIGSEHSFSGVVELVGQQAYVGDEPASEQIPGDLAGVVEREREALVESACEVDDDLINKYLEGEELSLEEIFGALREGTVEGQIVPVLCGSATGQKGIEPVLDAIVNLLPSAAQAAVRLEDGSTVESEADGEPAALVFKTISDPFIGKLS